MIERTEEMVQFAQAVTCGAEADECIAAAIDAALAIVERDYRVTKRSAVQPSRCDATHEDGTRCERTPHQAGLHSYSDYDAEELVTW